MPSRPSCPSSSSWTSSSAKPERLAGDDLAQVRRPRGVLGGGRPGHGGDRTDRGDRAPRDGGEAGRQLARADRLGHVVVGAGVEAGEDVVLLRAAADDDDVGAHRLADPPGDLQPVHLGHRHVDGRQGRAVLAGEGDAVGPVRRGDHREAGLGQNDLQQVHRVLVVVDDEGDRFGVHRGFRHGTEYHRSTGVLSGLRACCGVPHGWSWVHPRRAGCQVFERAGRVAHRMPVTIRMARPNRPSPTGTKMVSRTPATKLPNCGCRADQHVAAAGRTSRSRFPEPGSKSAAP